MPNERNQLTRQAASPDTITDPAADWVASNWTLKPGQWGFETDTGQVKLGDGITAWNDLAYFGGGAGGATVTTLYKLASEYSGLYAANPMPVFTGGHSFIQPALADIGPGIPPEAVTNFYVNPLCLPDVNTGGLRIENFRESVGFGRLVLELSAQITSLSVIAEGSFSYYCDVADAGYSYPNGYNWRAGVAAPEAVNNKFTTTISLPVDDDWDSDYFGFNLSLTQAVAWKPNWLFIAAYFYPHG